MKDNALEVARAALRAVELLDSDHYMAAIRIARRALRKIGRRVAEEQVKKHKTLSAYRARGTRQVRSLRRDNIGDDIGWIITDGYHVTVAKQKPGEESEAMTTLPRKTFNKLVRWYMREQKL